MSFDLCTYCQRYCGLGKFKRYSVIKIKIRYRVLLAKMQHVNTVSKSTCRDLLGRVVHVYVLSEPTSKVTVSQGCSLFLRFPNLPPGDSQSGVQPVYAVSEPTCRGLKARGSAFLSGY